jgi:hypothetical protein
MATPRVTLRVIKRKKQSLYQLDYSVKGKRFALPSVPTRRMLNLFGQKSNRISSWAGVWSRLDPFCLNVFASFSQSSVVGNGQKSQNPENLQKNLPMKN